nr:hypothetical protein [Methylobacterium radiotolerans JCM 2831]
MCRRSVARTCRGADPAPSPTAQPMGSMGPRKIHAPSPCLRSPNLTPHTVYRKRHAANWGRLNGKAGPKLAASQGFRGNTGPRFLGFSIRTAAESAISRRARADRQPGCGYAQVRESLPQIAVGDGGGRVHPMDRHPSSGRFAVAKRLPHHTIVLSAVTKPLRRAVSGFFESLPSAVGSAAPNPS